MGSVASSALGQRGRIELKGLGEAIAGVDLLTAEINWGVGEKYWNH